MDIMDITDIMDIMVVKEKKAIVRFRSLCI